MISGGKEVNWFAKIRAILDAKFIDYPEPNLFFVIVNLSK